MWNPTRCTQVVRICVHRIWKQNAKLNALQTIANQALRAKIVNVPCFPKVTALFASVQLVFRGFCVRFASLGFMSIIKQMKELEMFLLLVHSRREKRDVNVNSTFLFPCLVLENGRVQVDAK